MSSSSARSDDQQVLFQPFNFHLQYHLPVYLRAQVRHLGFLFTKAKKGKEVTEEHVGKAAKILCYLMDFFAEGLTPESLLESLENVDLPVTAIPESKPEAKTDAPPLKAINGNHQGLDSFLPAPAENREKATSVLIQETKAYLSGVDNALTRILSSQQTIFLAAKTVRGNDKDVDETAMIKWVVDRLWPCFEHATEMTKRNAIVCRMMTFRPQLFEFHYHIPTQNP